MRRTATITDEQERLRHISTLADESASVFDLLMGLLTHQVTTPPPCAPLVVCAVWSWWWCVV